MGYRKFTDREGHAWEVREESHSEWAFQPVSGNPEAPKVVRAPGYEKDPFELSEEELQLMLDSAGGARTRRPDSPFLD